MPGSLGLYYYSEWEEATEKNGPLVETIYPSQHQCCMPPIRYVPFPYVPAAVQAAVHGKKRIIDMGCGSDPVGRLDRLYEGVMAWTLEDGNDMRNVESLEAGSFDFIFSSHSIEHVPPADVPEMLLGWDRILEIGGEMLIIAPHRCSVDFSPIFNPKVYGWHLWCPTFSCVGNFFLSRGYELIDGSDHLCHNHTFWLWLRKITGKEP